MPEAEQQQKWTYAMRWPVAAAAVGDLELLDQSCEPVAESALTSQAPRRPRRRLHPRRSWRGVIILPEMVGSVEAVYNSKPFSPVEIGPEMIRRYLGEFSITYRPVKAPPTSPAPSPSNSHTTSQNACSRMEPSPS